MKRTKIFHFPPRKVIWRRMRVLGLVILTILLTLLSLKAEFRVWSLLFGRVSGYISCFVFETLRLILLWGFIKSKRNRIIFASLYLLFSCFFCFIGITSWFSEIIESHNKLDLENSRKINAIIANIKTTYSNRIKVDIEKMEQNINYVERKMIQDSSAIYLNRVIEHLQARRDRLIKNRDQLINENPSNVIEWIQEKSAMLGLRYNLDSIRVDVKLNSIENAFEKAWKLKPDTAKIVAAVVFTISIEIILLLLALILKGKNDNSELKNRSLINNMKETFEEKDLVAFVQRISDQFLKTGELPFASELTEKLRPIRHIIICDGYTRRDIKDLIRYYNDRKYLI